MTKPPHTSPAALLAELGISTPGEIDIEAIAQFCNATVLYQTLTGCEARIVGRGDRAIITVQAQSPRARQRFSAGHELGHWMRDRGRLVFACDEKDLVTEWSRDNPEQRANLFAADLLLPEYLFRPVSREREITFETVRDLAEAFTTSLTATGIRLVRLGSFPAVICCYDRRGRRWFTRGEDVPRVLWPRDDPGSGTVAYDILAGKAWNDSPIEVYADGWFDFEGADRFGIVEHSIPVTSELVLSLLWWKDESMLLEIEEGE